MARNGAVTSHLDRPPDAAFAAITDVKALPEWNERIVEVAVAPAGLAVGDSWVVVMEVLGRRFRSRSTVLELDPARRRFVHRSSPDDDNPSHTVWSWQVDAAGDGAAVTLAWELHPRTPSRYVMAWLRRRMIPAEAQASLRELARRC